MSSRRVNGLVNGILCGISSYGCFKIDPSAQPFAFGSCVVACSYSLLGLMKIYQKETVPVLVTKGLSRSTLQLGHISIINMGLYQKCGANNSSVVFGLCIAPLVYCMAIDPRNDIWLDLLTGLNIISLVHLTRVNGSWSCFLMAYLTLLACYGPDHLKQFGYRNVEEPIKSLSMAGISLLGIKAMVRGI